MLLKRLGGAGREKGTTKRGARRAEEFARMVAAGDKAVDGSGLGRGNRATPRQVAKLLIAMRDEPGGRAFRASLPMAGREGTLASRMRGTAAQGRCRAKTGTLDGVSALSGYCRAGDRHTIAFAILMNGVDVNAARRAQDAMAAAIARYRR
jgi:serine-type D-Ala-D-Ala carboxypeptidase/endopeptidase (penicillin-binding protein 4)